MAALSYPKIGTSAWRTLRARAADAPSTRFTAANVAALLGMANPGSAQTNIVRPLRSLGLITDEGTLTERGNKWRVDASYPAACEEILDDTYPEELKLLVNPDGLPDLTALRTWFDHKGFGGSNAQQMAATYALIASKRIPQGVMSEPKADGAKKSQRPKSSPDAKVAAAPSRANTEAVERPSAPHSSPPQPTGGPNVHLDIQIHIPADASLEQIDAIFASMAKHLYNT